MRVPVGVLLLGLALTACTKQDPAPTDQGSETKIGADNGGAKLGDPTPQASQQAGPTGPSNGVIPNKVIYPTRPAYGSLGTTAPSAQGGTTAAPAQTTPPSTATTTTAPASTGAPGAFTTPGRGVPPPPGGRPKPGTK